MLNKELESGLNKQINMEIWSGYLYLSMSYDMNHKCFPGISKWFMKQFHEELEHAKRLGDHILSLDGKVLLTPIGVVRQEWNSPKEAFEEALIHEEQVTDAIGQLYEQSVKLKQYSTLPVLEWFITEQIEEGETPRNILAALNKIADDPAAMYMLDQKLGKE